MSPNEFIIHTETMLRFLDYPRMITLKGPLRWQVNRQSKQYIASTESDIQD